MCVTEFVRSSVYAATKTGLTQVCVFVERVVSRIFIYNFISRVHKAGNLLTIVTDANTEITISLRFLVVCVGGFENTLVRSQYSIA